MNRKGQIDLEDINPIYVLLAIAAGLIGYFVSSRVPNIGWFIPIVTGLASMVLAYIYLALTDR